MTLIPILTAALAGAPAGAPEQVSHLFEQHLVAPPDRVLPLLTPLGERAWAPAWNPQMRWEPPGGGAGTLFVTRHPGHPETVWVLDTWEPTLGHVHYTHVTPGSDVTEIDIHLRPDGPAGTVATVRYTWTALGPAGVHLVRSKTPESYVRDMREWETELNQYLRRQSPTTGRAAP